MVTVLAAVALCFHATGSAQQLVTVDAPSARSTTAVVRVWRRQGTCWHEVAGPWPASVGYNGVSANHREGDGTTPLGTFPIGAVAYGVAPDPGTAFAYHRLVCGDWWDEDPSSPEYNHFEHVACGAKPNFGGGSEALWLDTRAYAHFLVVDYNTDPIIPGRGSGIFVHDDIGGPTNGCVSLPPADLVALMRLLSPNNHPEITIRLHATR
jgi:L,D-peptidoglycan transpeptidase YkuD (ErfK/YbiS/YcfS/YnhG family)